ncbi:penicillin-binding protein 1C [Parvicella tangerina]|uniref:peptidoglycan glycosyltransferase n=1 Tax=Parvicella tangerina TaxID=2829795 RepID=A0A916JMK3_9FLAO|nr:penicillin-binding protein 1C [Parvicella tangerina]CAG5083222.1 Biosynthetic peptidoglycan transglycosylase [Parvicella tangerina]
MNFWSKIKSFPKRFLGWIWRKKYYFLGAWAILFFVWLFCTPDEFFDDPTCTILTDKDGNILNARIADDGQWRFPPREDVPYKFKMAILQFEDRDFYEHWGISFKAFGRAMKQNLAAGKVVSGGSTITMQVVRLSRKGKSRTISEKLVEVFQATRMEWTYSKDEILAMYASYAPMGGNVVGIDAAAWRYFGRKADELSWAESCLLAVLPNAPSLMHLDKNRTLLQEKRDRLIDRLYEIGVIDKTEWQLALMEELPTAPPDLPSLAPHVIDKAIASGQKGQWVSSFLDSYLQNEVTNIIEYHHEMLEQNEIHNAAAIILDLETKQVLAYVGNTFDENNEHGNQVDVIKAPRSTGSILKPFLYAAMLEDGVITPSQLIEDVPMIISGYAPKNYNEKYDGVVPAHRALARSLNVPIVKMLKDYGVQKFHQKLNDIGLTTVNRPASDYGLSLVLGGAEASLWDLTAVYGNMALTLNNYEQGTENQFESFKLYAKSNPLNGKPFQPEAVWSTFEALLQVARPEEEGSWQQFNTSQKIAWKTGTSYGFRDAWAIGVTPRYAVGVWVGNADGEGRPGLVGVKAAAPILFDVFSRLDGTDWFAPPHDEMKELAICKETGFKASHICPNVIHVNVPKSCESAEVCPYHKHVHTTLDGKYRVNSSCELPHNMKTTPWMILPPLAEKFYKQKNPTYQPVPPYRSDCQFDESVKPLAIAYPKKESHIYIPTNLDETKSKTVFEATHSDAQAIIYWHLDDQYIGQTVGIHQLELIPSIGKHELRIIDQEGFETSVTFEVINE